MSKSVVLTRKAAMTLGALVGFLQPKLAKDAKINFHPVLNGLTSKNFKDKKAGILKTLTEQCKSHLAQDASIDGLMDLLDGLETADAAGPETNPNAALPMKDMETDDDPLHLGEVEDADPSENLRGFLKEKGMSDDDISAACDAAGFGKADDEDVGSEKKSEEGLDDEGELAEGKKGQKAEDKEMGEDDPPPFKGSPKVGGGMDTMRKELKTALKKQELATDAAIKDAVKKVKENAAAVREAERFVRPWVGDIEMAHDSAEDVFKTALTALGKKTEGIHPSAYRAILESLPKPGKEHQNLAQDSLDSDSDGMTALAKRIPGIDRIKVMS